MITAQFIATVNKLTAAAFHASMMNAEVDLTMTTRTSPDDPKDASISGKIVMDPKMKPYVVQTALSVGILLQFE